MLLLVEWKDLKICKKEVIKKQILRALYAREGVWVSCISGILHLAQSAQ